MHLDLPVWFAYVAIVFMQSFTTQIHQSIPKQQEKQNLVISVQIEPKFLIDNIEQIRVRSKCRAASE